MYICVILLSDNKTNGCTCTKYQLIRSHILKLMCIYPSIVNDLLPYFMDKIQVSYLIFFIMESFSLENIPNNFVYMASCATLSSSFLQVCKVSTSFTQSMIWHFISSAGGNAATLHISNGDTEIFN